MMSLLNFLSPSLHIPMIISVASLLVDSSDAQITTSCTATVITNFTPCLNYLTGSINGANGGSSPTAECCKSVASLLNGSAQCGCLILTGNVPISLPINRTLAISLPQKCNYNSVPIFQCKGYATPLPPPGPVTYGPSLPPLSGTAPSESFMPGAPSVLPPFDDLPTPATGESDAPTVEGLKPLLLPSAASMMSRRSTPSLLLLAVIITSMLFLDNTDNKFQYQINNISRRFNLHSNWHKTT